MASRNSAASLLVLVLAGCRSGKTGVDVDTSTDGAPPSPDAATVPKGYPGLVGHWRFDERGGTVALDSSPSGSSGALKGGALLSSGGFAGAKFPNTGSLVLDGVDGRVALEAKRLP